MMELLVKRENHSCLRCTNVQDLVLPLEFSGKEFSIALFWKNSNLGTTVVERRILIFSEGGSINFLLRTYAQKYYATWVGNADITTSETLVPNNFYHFAVSVKNGNAKLYTDGNLVANGTFAGEPTLKFDGISTGKTLANKDYQQLKIYDRELSADEILTLYRQYPISRVGLVGEWDLNGTMKNTSIHGATLDGSTTGSFKKVEW